MVREAMTMHEFLLRMLVAIQPALPSVLAVLLITMAVAAVLLVQAKGFWVDQKRFRWLGVFYELEAEDRVCLACSWLRLLLLLTFLVQFQKLDAIRCILFLVPSLLCVLMTKTLKKIPGKFLWFVLEIVALVTTNLVCGFYHDVQSSAGFLVVYVLMALFTALLGIYLFLMDLSDISEGRRAHIHE